MDQDIKSRPRYRPLALDASGRRHLLVCDLPSGPDPGLADPADFAAVETWRVGQPDFPAAAILLARLESRLAGERIGLRLYAVGTEAFLWDAAGLARGAGMGEGEFFVCHAGSLRRRVQCVHCKTMLDAVATNLVDCRGCGAKLFVRDHFSRRLSAFMGVRVDAERPGEWPETVEWYR